MAAQGYTPTSGSQVPNDQAVHGLAITLSSDTTLATPSRWIWVGGTGNLVVQLVGDTTTTTLTGVAAGALLPLSAAVIKSTGNGTTATNIVVLW